MMTTIHIRATDNDINTITVRLDGRELREWSYANDEDRKQKISLAREYIEGWRDGLEASKSWGWS